MGILNVTPDSFSDGGCFFSSEAAVDRGLQMVEEGAEILDIGGESTRPGSEPVDANEELRRVLPVLKKLRSRSSEVLLSIDTSKALVAEACLDAGADIVNDVTALRGDAGMLPLLAKSNCGVVLMHMLGTPKTMQSAPTYQDVVAEVREFLENRILKAADAGIDASRICIDPGFGFGKTFEHNKTLLAQLEKFTTLGAPLLVGISRKSFLGHALGGVASEDRLWAGVAVSSYARKCGASIFRVHDVRENLHALRMTEAILHHA